MIPVCVVIPAYNAERVLRRSIEGVLNQTVSPAAIIVVDDGSVDDTSRIAHGYGPAVTCIRQDNAGVSRARNRGITSASAEWVAFLDADDEWLPHKLEDQWKILTRNPELMWCGTTAELVFAERTEVPKVASDLLAALDRVEPVPFFSSALHGLCLQTSGFLIRRTVFQEVGMFDPTLRVVQDRDLWWRIAMKYPLLGYSPRAGYRWYVDTPGSLTKQAKDRTQSLQALCDNMRRATELGGEIAQAFRRYGRVLALDYLMRDATREISLSPPVVADASTLFRVTAAERLGRRSLKLLPAKLARPLGRALWPYHGVS